MKKVSKKCVLHTPVIFKPLPKVNSHRSPKLVTLTGPLLSVLTAYFRLGIFVR
jgi:hypothetical protein